MKQVFSKNKIKIANLQKKNRKKQEKTNKSCIKFHLGVEKMSLKSMFVSAALLMKMMFGRWSWWWFKIVVLILMRYDNRKCVYYFFTLWSPLNQLKCEMNAKAYARKNYNYLWTTKKNTTRASVVKQNEVVTRVKRNRG